MSEETESYEGIGGWLLLPLIGLVVAPVQISLILYNDLLPVFTRGYWDILTTPGTDAYHPLWAPLILYELTGNVAFIILCGVLLWLFFKRYRAFPRLIIACLVLNLLFVGGDFLFAGLVPQIAEGGSSNSLRELVRAVAGIVIWVPYFLVSTRVKRTFVR